jgi:hypothetical protein
MAIGYTLSQGDYGVSKTATIFNKDGSIKDLTGYNVSIIIFGKSPEIAGAVVTYVNEAVTVTNAVGGRVMWTVSQADAALLLAVNSPYFGIYRVTSTSPNTYQDSTIKFFVKVDLSP